MLVIDAANVISSRPTGWWRGRPGAARRLSERVQASVAAGELDAPLTIVLEGQARSGVDEGGADGVVVVHAPGEGDDTTAAVAGMHDPVVVVTADRGVGRAGTRSARYGRRAEVAARPAPHDLMTMAVRSTVVGQPRRSRR